MSSRYCSGPSAVRSTASTGTPSRSRVVVEPAGGPPPASAAGAAVPRTGGVPLGSTEKATLTVCPRFSRKEGLNFVTFVSHGSPKTLPHHAFTLFNSHEFSENPLVFIGFGHRIQPAQPRFEVCDPTVDGMNSDCADDLLGPLFVEFPVDLDRFHRQLGEEGALRVGAGGLAQLSGPPRRVLHPGGPALLPDEVEHLAVPLDGEHLRVELVEAGAQHGVLHPERT